MNNRREVLKKHLEKINELQEKTKTANDELIAYTQAFNGWLHNELGLPKDKLQVTMPEILMKWDETAQ